MFIKFKSNIKMMENRDSSSTPAFKEIAYINQKQIHYLDDISEMGPRYVSFLESLNFNQVHQDKQVSSFFDHTIDKLQKKILQGSLDPPSKVSKKNKKGDSDINYYNANDQFINDEECGVEKKDKQSTFQDFVCVQMNSIEDLYANPIYNKKIEDVVVQTGKRRNPEQFTLKEDHQLEKFDEIKKLIGDKILNKNLPPEAEPQEKTEKEDKKEEKENDKVEENNDPAILIEQDSNEVQILVHPPPEIQQQKQ